ncbi:hypothetical protein CS542_03025 [Pedobacter sp. IW39]|nr:hypothetical protein CS542_03025 [Pedobacter sp. IW39]
MKRAAVRAFFVVWRDGATVVGKINYTIQSKPVYPFCHSYFKLPDLLCLKCKKQLFLLSLILADQLRPV